MEVIEEEECQENEESERKRIEDQFDLSLYKDDMMQADNPGDEMEPGAVNELCTKISFRIKKWQKRIWKSIKLNCLQNSSI